MRGSHTHNIFGSHCAWRPLADTHGVRGDGDHGPDGLASRAGRDADKGKLVEVRGRGVMQVTRKAGAWQKSADALRTVYQPRAWTRDDGGQAYAEVQRRAPDRTYG